MDTVLLCIFYQKIKFPHIGDHGNTLPKQKSCNSQYISPVAFFFQILFENDKLKMIIVLYSV